jgi:hypothetical protein
LHSEQTDETMNDERTGTAVSNLKWAREHPKRFALEHHFFNVTGQIHRTEKLNCLWFFNVVNIDRPLCDGSHDSCNFVNLHVPPFSGAWLLMTAVTNHECFKRMAISRVSLWPFPANWNSFLISFDGIRRCELFGDEMNRILWVASEIEDETFSSHFLLAHVGFHLHMSLPQSSLCCLCHVWLTAVNL